MTKRRGANGPDDLPPDLPETEVQSKKTALDTARFCPTCGVEARIHSNHDGVRAYCGPCKTDWAVSGPTALALPLNLPRGLSKQTYVQPDISMAFEDLDWDEEYMRGGDKKSK